MAMVDSWWVIIKTKEEQQNNSVDVARPSPQAYWG